MKFEKKACVIQWKYNKKLKHLFVFVKGSLREDNNFYLDTENIPRFHKKMKKILDEREYSNVLIDTDPRCKINSLGFLACLIDLRNDYEPDGRPNITLSKLNPNIRTWYELVIPENMRNNPYFTLE